MSKNICLIPAKAASTRLPKKNILPINGKEMMSYGINAALSSGLFGEDVYVSTESEEIRDIAVKYNAKVPYIRSKELSVDPSTVVDVAMDFLEKQPQFKSYDNLFIVLPTAPLVNATDLQTAFSIFNESDAKSLMSVSECEHNSQRSIFIRDNKLVPLFEDGIRKKSQQLETTYYINGAVTIINMQEFLKQRTYMFHPLAVYVIPRERGVDIDTKLDYLWAKFLMEHNSPS